MLIRGIMYMYIERVFKKYEPVIYTQEKKKRYTFSMENTLGSV